MLKLKPEVIENLNLLVKGAYLDSLVELFEEEIKREPFPVIDVISENTLSNLTITIHLSLEHFREVEDLKPYKWYPAKDFDKNPKGYWLIERCDDGEVYGSTDPLELDCLILGATHFMYIEPLEAEDEAK